MKTVAGTATVVVLKLVAVPGTVAFGPIIGLAGTVFAGLFLYGLLHKTKELAPVPEPEFRSIVRPPKEILPEISVGSPIGDIRGDHTFSPAQALAKALERPCARIKNSIIDRINQPAIQKYIQGETTDINVRRKLLQEIGGDVSNFDIIENNRLADKALTIVTEVAKSQLHSNRAVLEVSAGIIKDSNRERFRIGINAAKNSAFTSYERYSDHIGDLLQVIIKLPYPVAFCVICFGTVAINLFFKKVFKR